MLIEKIISSGRRGADSAALDVAIKQNLLHGGWIPKGRKTEDGPQSEKYHLREVPTAGHSGHTEQNVMDSDGTLIISHGELEDPSALTSKIATRHGKDWLHIDLDTIRGFSAARVIKSWIIMNDIRVLNVTGSRASKDSEIYDDTVRLLTAVFNLFFLDSKKVERSKPLYPRTVEDAVDRLLVEVPMKQRVSISSLEEGNIVFIYPTLGRYIRDNYGLHIKNGALITDCRCRAEDRTLDEDSAAFLILKEFWKVLKKTHTMRVIKRCTEERPEHG